MPTYKPFTHRIFVDFSGDDGHYSTPGSSQCICIAWVLSREEDLYHNQGIVLKIKDTIGCQPKHELKYKTLRHHKKRDAALELISRLRIKVVIVPVFKKYLDEQELQDPHTKRLVNFIHTFPLNKFYSYMVSLESPIYFQLVFDEVSWVGCCDEIRNIFRSDDKLDWGNERPDWLLFAKSRSNLMIQLADVISGIGREFSEGLVGETLPPCLACTGKKMMHRCPYKLGKLEIPGEGLFNKLKPLLLQGKGKCFEEGFVVRPPNRARYFRFVDCI